jgi:hypothetical protein
MYSWKERAVLESVDMQEGQTGNGEFETVITFREKQFLGVFYYSWKQVAKGPIGPSSNKGIIFPYY